MHNSVMEMMGRLGIGYVWGDVRKGGVGDECADGEEDGKSRGVRGDR